MYDIVYHNGHYKKINDVNIGINDRGFLYGHSVYESIAIFNGNALFLEEHFSRLAHGLNALDIPNTFDCKKIKEIIDDLCKRNNIQENVKCYIQITAGDTELRNYTDFGTPNIIIRFYEWNTKQSLSHKAILMDDLRWGLCHVKSNSLAYNAIAGKKASLNQAVEVIFIKDNYVQECSTSNVFICQENTIYTPDNSQQLLPGVTRQWVINNASTLGIDVVQRKIHIDELIHADEVFITASYKGIHPITSINGKAINQNKIGNITLKIQENYHNECYQMCTH